MSRTIRDKIFSKLQRLDEYVGYLKELSKYKEATFVSDYRIYGLGERYLQLSIEIMLDVGKLMVIKLELEKPETNHQLFDTLRGAKIITPKLYQSLSGIAGFRNILVHEYERIDRSIVYGNLKDGIKDLGAFKKAILKKL